MFIEEKRLLILREYHVLSFQQLTIRKIRQTRSQTIEHKSTQKVYCVVCGKALITHNVELTKQNTSYGTPLGRTTGHSYQYGLAQVAWRKTPGIVTGSTVI